MPWLLLQVRDELGFNIEPPIIGGTVSCFAPCSFGSLIRPPLSHISSSHHRPRSSLQHLARMQLGMNRHHFHHDDDEEDDDVDEEDHGGSDYFDGPHRGAIDLDSETSSFVSGDEGFPRRVDWSFVSEFRAAGPDHHQQGSETEDRYTPPPLGRRPTSPAGQAEDPYSTPRVRLGEEDVESEGAEDSFFATP